MAWAAPLMERCFHFQIRPALDGHFPKPVRFHMVWSQRQVRYRSHLKKMYTHLKAGARVPSHSTFGRACLRATSLHAWVTKPAPLPHLCHTSAGCPTQGRSELTRLFCSQVWLPPPATAPHHWIGCDASTNRTSSPRTKRRTASGTMQVLPPRSFIVGSLALAGTGGQPGSVWTGNSLKMMVATKGVMRMRGLPLLPGA